MGNKIYYTRMATFKEEFEKEFIDFFLVSTLVHNNEEDKELLYDFAIKLYAKIFDANVVFMDEKKELEEIKEYGIKIENSLSLSLLFLLKSFITYVNNENKDIKLIEVLTEKIFQYNASLEKECITPSVEHITYVSFDANENIVFGKNIIDHFKEIKQRDEEVTFFNLYQGVPISNKGKVLDIEGEDVSFKTSRMQEIAMKLEGIAYILKDERFDKHIRANIVYNNFLENSMTLNNFTYLLNMPASQREFVRVHPNITAFVTLQENEDEYTSGKLYDLSTDGLGVVGEDKKNLYIGASIRVSFSINGKNIETRGKLVNILEYADSYRFCIRIEPSEEEKKSIEEYVALRQEEILAELRKHLEEYGL